MKTKLEGHLMENYFVYVLLVRIVSV